MRFGDIPAEGRATARLGSHRRGDLALWHWLIDMHELPPAGRDTAGVSTDLLGTVAVVGFPNVGKSTLVNSAHRHADGRRARDPGRDTGSQGADLRVVGHRFRLIDTGGVDIVDPRP